MKLYKQDLLTLLISLFIFTGCENPDSIGLDVDPDNAIEGKLIDTLTIKSATVKEDSTKTNSLTKYPLGHLTDPVFGITDSKLAVSLTLPSESLTFGTSPVLDSAVLVLKYADEYSGDANSRLFVEVEQLASRLTISSDYYNTTEHPVNANGVILGSKAFKVNQKDGKVNLKDSITVTDILKGKPDVTIKKAPQLRIPISAQFIQDNFFNTAAANLATNTAFNDFIKGLHIKINGASTTGAGGLATFDLASTDTRLELYYKSQGASAIDTTVTTFAINPAFSAATIKHNYSNTPVQAQLNNPAGTYTANYVQPLGVKTKIRFPHIQNLKSLGEISINKAELVVQVEGGSDIFAPAPRIFVYRTDIADQRQLIPDVALGLNDLALGGFYDIPKKQYRFTMTAYIQDILSGRLTQYDTFITAVDEKASSSTALLPSATTVSRSVIGSGIKSAPYTMKLNIIYTKAN
ncbi:DUF4270 domain-containing protein [Flavihumibacter sp. R14]|nr:DUF4270 domain-containing protein [Flavihumibacter soli]